MSYNRRAFLTWIRNVESGLRSRTAILEAVEQKETPTTTEIASVVNISYSTVLYHLKNMEKESIVTRDPVTGSWRLVDQGQSQLIDFA